MQKLFKWVALTGILAILPQTSFAQAPDGLVLVSDSPVFGLGEAAAWDGGLVAVGAVVVEDGVFHLLYNGGSADHPMTTSIWHATSPDGINWTRDEANPILTPDAVAATPAPANLTALSALKVGDEWIVYFAAYAAPGNLNSIQIYRATAPSLSGPYAIDESPIVFGPGSARQWDSSIDAINIIATDDGYVMYYTGCCSQGHNFGRATSPDGINWTKYDDPATTERAFAESDPVYRHQPNTWSHYINMPNVLPTADGWALIYQGVPEAGGEFGIGYATSADGLTWTDYADNPLFIGPLLTSHPYDRLRSSVIVDGTLMVYFDPAWDSDVTGIYLATWALPTE